MRAFALLGAVLGWQVGPGRVRAPPGRPLPPAHALPSPAGSLSYCLVTLVNFF